jgi:hypothetical protein
MNVTLVACMWRPCIPMEIRRKIAEYMTTLDLLEPDKIISPRELVPHLKVIKNEWICKFRGCGQCSTSESGTITLSSINRNISTLSPMIPCATPGYTC